MPTQTLIILNPHAGSGRAGKLWTELEPLLWKLLGELVIAVTQHPNEVAPHLDYAYTSGIRRVIAIGGDGTNHSLINALVYLNAQHPDAPMTYGNLPIGTGRDWARGAGIPSQSPEAAARWIAQATPHPVDIGLLKTETQTEHFLNIASVGMSGEIATRINQQTTRRPWTFLYETAAAVLRHVPRLMRVRLDDNLWYDGRAYLVAVANGSTFGHGMKIAPDAQVNDGLFDVVLVEAMPRLAFLAALGSVYSGTHVTHPHVKIARAARVQIEHDAETMDMELDGEYASGRSLTFEVKPAALAMLI